MTLEDIQKRIDAIKGKSGDDEVQHAWEDSLYGEFIEYIAAGNSEYAELAKLILTTKDIDFARWCA